MRNKRQIKLIMDNGGGIALHVYADRYSHHYDNASQVARDLMQLISGADCSSWDNNEWDTLSDRSDECSREYFGTPSQVIDRIIQEVTYDDCYGSNHIDLYEALMSL